MSSSTTLNIQLLRYPRQDSALSDKINPHFYRKKILADAHVEVFPAQSPEVQEEFAGGRRLQGEDGPLQCGGDSCSMQEELWRNPQLLQEEALRERKPGHDCGVVLEESEGW